MLALGLTNVENKEKFKVDKTWKQIENLLLWTYIVTVANGQVSFSE